MIFISGPLFRTLHILLEIRLFLNRAMHRVKQKNQHPNQSTSYSKQSLKSM